MRKTVAGCIYALRCLAAIAFLVAVPVPGLAAQGGPLPRIAVGSEIDFPPYADTDSFGRAYGFSVDLMRAACEAMGISVHFQTGPWKAVWEGLLAGRFDALPLVAWSPERAEQVDMTRPHTVAYDAFFGRSGEETIEDLAKAEGKEIVVMAADAAHQELLARGFKGRIVVTETIPEALRLVAAGRHDAALLPKLLGILVLRELRLTEVVAPGPAIPEYNRRFAIAVRKGDSRLRDLLDQGVAIVKATGSYDAIYQKWFGDIEPTPLPWRAVAMGAVVSGLAILALAGWSLSLRRIVAARTAELAREVEARRIMETARLREESERRVRRIADAVPSVLFVTDPAGAVVWRNRWWYTYTGQPPEESLGFGWVKAVHPADRKVAMERWREAVAAGRPFLGELRYCRHDGVFRWHLVRVEPVLSPDDGITEWFGVGVDIEERKDAERARDRANEAKSRFLAAASHDLRQPFQAMRLFHEVLRNSRLSGPQAEAVERLGEAMSAGEQLLHALLDISVLDSGHIQPKIGVVDLGQLIAEKTAETTPLAAEKGLRLRSHASGAHVRSDPVMLRRILDNLVANAIRYTAVGGVLIACRRRGAAVRIEVWDTGRGIPADQLEEVFEEFRQLGNHERDRAKGLGLGLAVVQRLSALLGHTVGVRSQLGRGSVFWIELPLAVDQPALLDTASA